MIEAMFSGVPALSGVKLGDRPAGIPPRGHCARPMSFIAP